MNVSASDEGPDPADERETKLKDLRATLDASIAEGGEVTDEALNAALAEACAELRSRGFREERGDP